jgi:hypothetical protein
MSQELDIIGMFLPLMRHEQHSTNLSRRRNRIRRILDTRPPGFERTEEEEEGIRASEAIERILCMLNESV